jgi:hypothetical protein
LTAVQGRLGEVIGICVTEQLTRRAAGAQPCSARPAGSATRRERDEHSIPRRETGNIVPDGNDLPDNFMTGDNPKPDSFPALVWMKIRPAQPGPRDGDDGIGRLLKLRFRQIGSIGNDTYTVEGQAAHDR